MLNSIHSQVSPQKAWIRPVED